MTKVNEVLHKCLVNNGSAENSAKYKAAVNIKALLSEIDLNVEVVPVNNPEMFTRLITSLKGEQLTIEEAEIINEITK